MGAKEKGIQYDAGIVTADEVLTKQAKKVFIEDVKNELLFGTGGFVDPLPCGPDIAPNPFADMLDLENEEKFPDFHQNILKALYEKTAAEMNLEGGFTLLPICDPFALAIWIGKLHIKIPKLGDFLDFMIPNLPNLALAFRLKPPELALKFPEIPGIPPSFPEFKLPAILPLPQLLDINLDLNFALKLPKPLFPDLVAKIPDLMLKLPNFPELFKLICDLISDAKIITGKFDSIAIVRVASYKVLIHKIAEMMLLIAVGKTLGSSPNGIVGGMGREFRYIPPTDPQPEEEEEEDVRDRIVEYAMSCIEPVELKWGNINAHPDGGTIQEIYCQRLLYTEYGAGDNIITDKNDPRYDSRVLGRQATIHKAESLSSCGLFARACYYAAGASYVFSYNNKNVKTDQHYDFFQDEYKIFKQGGPAIDGLVQAAKAKDALVAGINDPERPIPRNDLNGKYYEVKRGDVIIVWDPERFRKSNNSRAHAMVVIEDYVGGSRELVTAEGGQADDHHKSNPTAVRKKIYRDPKGGNFDKKTNFGFSIEGAGSSAGTIKFSGREIYAIINGEKLCDPTTSRGNRTSPPHAVTKLYDVNDPSRDEKLGLLPPEETGR